jgi:hypothetical protein
MAGETARARGSSDREFFSKTLGSSLPRDSSPVTLSPFLSGNEVDVMQPVSYTPWSLAFTFNAVGEETHPSSYCLRCRAWGCRTSVWRCQATVPVLGISERIDSTPGDVNFEGLGEPRIVVTTGRKGRRGRNGCTTHMRSVSWGDVTRRLNGRRRR